MRWFCTRQIKMRIVIAKEAFNRKISLFAKKLNSGRNWLGVTFGSWLRDLDTKKIGAEIFGEF